MHKRPLAVIAVFFIIGIVLGWFLPDSVTLFNVFIGTLILITLTLLLSLKSERGAHVFLFLSIISLGSLLYLNSNIFPSNHISHFLGKDKVKAEITGVIKSPAEARGVYYGKVSSRYVFEIERLEVSGIRYQVTGLVLIRIETEKDYQYGDRLRVNGAIKRPLTSPKGVAAERLRKNVNAPFRALPHSEFNYREYLERQNIFAFVNTKEKDITLLSHDYRVNPVIRFAYRVREKIKGQFLEKMPLESGAFMRAILLGDRSELPKRLTESFRNSGTFHIIAISGLHVGLITMCLLYLFRVLRLTRWLSYILTMLFLVFFAVLTLSMPPVVRAVVMACVFLIGMLLGRPVDMYNSLGTACLFILIQNPKSLFDVGFQLSFLAVLSILYLVPRFGVLLKDKNNVYLKKFFYLPLAISISAWLGTSLLTLYYFGLFTPISIIANLAIVPMSFAVLLSGICFVLLGWVPFLNVFLAAASDVLMKIMFFMADFFSSVPFGHTGS